MQRRVLSGVERYKVVGHDATAAIHGAMLAYGVIAQRVGKVNTISAIQLAMFEAFFNVHGIVGLVALGVRLLYAATCGCVIVGDGKTYHRSVFKLDGALHQSLAKRASAHHLCAVLVLQRACHNLGC